MTRMNSGLTRILAITAFLTFTAAAQADTEQIVTQSSGTIDCHENSEAGIMSRNANLTFVGPCTALNFLGSGTTATIEHVDVLIVSSRNINITVDSPVEELNVVTAAGSRIKAKDIETLGVLSSDVNVQADHLKRLVVRGSNNVVTWTGSDPVLEDMGGSNNSFSQR